MPMIFGISGYLIKENEFLKINIVDLIIKYYFRLFLPWLIVWYFYFIYFYYGFIITNTLTLEMIIYAMILPMFHLWFIPSLFFFILLTWIIKHTKISDYFFLVIIVIITIFSVYLINSQILSHNLLIYKAIDKYHPEFYVFFFLGYSLRNRKIRSIVREKLKYIGLTIIPFYFLSLYIYFNINRQLLSLPFFLYNFSMIVFFLLFLNNFKFNKFKYIKWIGINSLPIYLYHLLIFFISLELLPVGLDRTLLFLLTNFFILLSIIFLYILAKIDILPINMYLFGKLDDVYEYYEDDS